MLELEAIHRAMIHWLRKLMNLTVLVVSDNSTVMSYINKQAEHSQYCFVDGPHVSSAPGTTHPREIEHSCRHPIAPCPDIRYRMVPTPICLPSTDTGMGNALTGSVCNEVESQTSTICVPHSRSISHGSRCSVNELEGTVGIHIPTTTSVASAN